MHFVSTQAEEVDQEAQVQSERVCQGRRSARKEEKEGVYIMCSHGHLFLNHLEAKTIG